MLVKVIATKKQTNKQNINQNILYSLLKAHLLCDLFCHLLQLIYLSYLVPQSPVSGICLCLLFMHGTLSTTHNAVKVADCEAALTEADLQREPQRTC